MQTYDGKRKSFTMKMSWIGVLFLVLGIVFLSVGLIMQIVSLQPESFTSFQNGVQAVGTAETVRIFRLIFLLTFGLIGLVFLCIGLVMLIRNRMKRRMERALVETGVRVSAKVTGTIMSNMQVNYRFLERLTCIYERNGITYEFKSEPLRQNPMEYLPDGMVAVYFDRDNMRRYFVDIDGTVSAKTKIVSL